jgi:hypothetical protein
MLRTKNGRDRMPFTHASFDAPELTFIGNACDVVMGMPGGGFDGRVGMTEPPFEFEVDDDGLW